MMVAFQDEQPENFVQQRPFVQVIALETSKLQELLARLTQRDGWRWQDVH